MDDFGRCITALDGDRGRERLGQPAFPSVTSRVYLLWALAKVGQFTQGVRLAEEVTRIAHSVEHPY